MNFIMFYLMKFKGNSAVSMIHQDSIKISVAWRSLSRSGALPMIQQATDSATVPPAAHQLHSSTMLLKCRGPRLAAAMTY